MQRILLSAAIVVVGVSVSALQPPSSARRVRDIQSVRGNLYFITGGDSYEVGGRPSWTGGNVAVFVTAQGAVVVDSMIAGSGREILAQVRRVTDKPVTMLINTHTHYDHTGSNGEFRPASTSWRTRTRRRTWPRWTISRGPTPRSCRRAPSRT